MPRGGEIRRLTIQGHRDRCNVRMSDGEEPKEKHVTDEEEESDSKETDELKVVALPGPLATPLRKFWILPWPRGSGVSSVFLKSRGY